MVKYTQKGKMAPKGYSKIQSNYTFLLGDLEPTSICFALFQEHLFDQNDIEKVTSKAGTKEQNNQILTILLERSGHNSYEKFIDVLKNLNYDHAVEILESECSDDSDESGFIEFNEGRKEKQEKKSSLARFKEAILHRGTPNVAFKAKDADITRLKQEREAKIRESKRLESKARDEEIARLKQEQESKRLSKVIDELQETQKKQWKQIIDYEAMLNSTPSMERNTESIKCNQCLHTVAHGSDLLNIPGVGALEKSTVTVFGAEGVLKQKFINETDDIFDVYTTSKADIKVTSNRIGHPKYVWYDIGYDWSYMHCKGKECKNQIGWKYQKNGDTPFYGLIDANVTD
ncbi:uncharacterized protein LOC126822114 isoform X3 [Patella vulgata]|uniref:uncharacterized protein LOC126822114 isoform X3 n=1 Tax=Patella vulgata TaxID=6465 RepID=UPI0021806221|nr:uncharacterized protein LOC126822114 isoform X3 [Patella vulgata]